MKKIILFTAFIFSVSIAPAQYVGIGTTVPSFKLDVSGGSINTDSVYRINGGTVLSIKGTANTFVGTSSGFSNTTGTHNSGFGFRSLYSNTTGTYNTAAGMEALYSSTDGTGNTAFGSSSLYSNSIGAYNAATGHGALYKNSTGNYNTGMGAFVLFANTTGVSNSAYGVDALRSNTTGNYNTAVGVHALYSTSTDRNTAIGYDALIFNQGYNNTALGYGALFSNNSGVYNTAAGHGALHNNTGGIANTAIGETALYRNISGSDNVAIGRDAMDNILSGIGNTGIGSYALRHTTGGDENTAIGFYAGWAFNNGYYNTFLGAHSRANADGYFNSIAIGNTAIVTASNQARIGNSSTTSIGGFVNWTNISDGRFKKNIQEDVKGLDFIMKLRPVTYSLDIVTLSKQLNEQKSGPWNEDMQKALSEKEKMIHSGFIAQEVEDAAKELGYDFSGIDKPKNENGLYGLRYAEFVVPLVKAVQEQQEMIKLQQSQIDELKKAIKELRNQ